MACTIARIRSRLLTLPVYMKGVMASFDCM